MDFEVKNKYKVEFKDGSTPLTSNGSSKSLKKSSIAEELDWLKFHIEKELMMSDRTISDVKSVSININYQDL